MTDRQRWKAWREAISAMGRKGGKASAEKLTHEQRKARSSKGGLASAAALTPGQRQARAQNAAASRWAKRRAAG